MKRILNIAITILLFAGVLVLLGFIRQEHNHKACSNLEIDMVYSNTDTLLTCAEIRQLLANRFGAPEGQVLQAKTIASIREEILGTHYIEHCDIDLMLNGTLRIRANQRIPVAKIMFGSHACYIDDKGIVMPYTWAHPHRLLIISGNLTHLSELRPGNDLHAKAALFPVFREGSMYQAILVAQHIHRDTLLQSLIEQIYANQQSELELYTHVGKQRILFGDGTDTEKKLDKLVKFYRSEKAIQYLDIYKIINLKYNNQVVCSKI